MKKKWKKKIHWVQYLADKARDDNTKNFHKTLSNEDRIGKLEVDRNFLFGVSSILFVAVLGLGVLVIF